MYLELPFRLKICYAFFFIQGAFAMLLSIIVWFIPDKEISDRIILFIVLVLILIMNIEIGKGLKNLKKWSYVVAIILCIIQSIFFYLRYTHVSVFTIGAIVVMTLLFTVKNYFWNEIKNINMDDFYTYFNSGIDKLISGNYKVAIKKFNKAIKINPYYEATFFRRGYSNAQLGNHQEAILDYNKAISLNPNYAESFVRRGLSKCLIGDKEGGCQDLKKGGELGDEQASEYIEEHCK